MSDADDSMIEISEEADARLMPPPPPPPPLHQVKIASPFSLHQLSVQERMETNVRHLLPTPPPSQPAMSLSLLPETLAPRSVPAASTSPNMIAEPTDEELQLLLFSGGEDLDKGAKTQRHRYWTSWEEVRIIELWRRYRSEVVTLEKNTPVFRKIYDGMREVGIHVNSQECRRKINALKNRYIRHCSSLMAQGQPAATSKWAPYALINAFVTSHNEPKNLNHEEMIVNEVLSMYPPELDESRDFGSRKLSFFRFSTHITDQLRNYAMNKTRLAPYPSFDHYEQAAPAVLPPVLPPVLPLVLPPVLPVPPVVLPPVLPPVQWVELPTSTTKVFRIRSIMPTLEELREDNRRLTTQRDAALQKLRLQTRDNECLSKMMKNWLQMQLAILDSISV